MSEASREWFSVHLFFDGSLYSAAADRVILDLVAPLVHEATRRGWVERHFFVRYREGGPHVRLRLCGRRPVLKERVQPLLADRAAAFSSLPGGVRPRPIPYEPEFDRYGGADGVTLAERFFHISSDTAIALLRGIDLLDRGSRLGKALLAMLVVTQAFHPDRARAAAFLHAYGTRYLRALAQSEEYRDSFRRAFDAAFTRQAAQLTQHVAEGWQRLERSEPLSSALDPYVKGVDEIRREFERLTHLGHLRQREQTVSGVLDAVGRIVPSYLHMMNNRLGVPIPYEAYLANLIRRVLAAPALASS